MARDSRAKAAGFWMGEAGPVAQGTGRRSRSGAERVDRGRRRSLRGRWRHRVLFPGVIGIVALLLAGCGHDPQSALTPAGPVAQTQLWLMLDSLWIMLGVFAVVMAALVYVLIRFRHRKGYNDEVPQVHGSTRLELLWTIIPAILIIIIAIPTVEQSFVLGAVQPPKDRPINVQVVGHQYWFQFDYTGYHIETADEMHVPVDRKINLSMTSADVMHSFWVPSLAGKTDLIPGKITTLWFEATRPGIYTGQCAEYCGYGHADMHIIVKAESAAAFQRWVHRMHHPVSTPQTALARQGMTIFAEVGCSACHAIAGTQFQGTIGPNLTDLANRPIIAGGALPNTTPAMKEWLRNPPGVVPGSLMPNLHLSSSQIDALTAYLRGLK